MTGNTTQLGSSISAPPVTMQVATNPGGVSSTPNVTTNVSWQGGTYYFTSLTVVGGCTISFQGAATVYLDGNVTFNDGSSIIAYNNIPANLIINQASGKTLTLSTNNVVVGLYRGPSATLNVGFGCTIRGSAVASTFSCAQNDDLFYDESLGSGSSGRWAINLVQ